MFKKLFSIAVVCLISIVLSQTDANAIRRVISGWGVTSTELTFSIEGEGMGNYTRFPGAITVEVLTRYATALCANPQKKKWPTRLGTPYFWHIDLTGESASEDWSVAHNGAFQTQIIFTHDELFGVGTECPEGACDTNKWWDCALDDEGNPILLLQEFDAHITLRSDVDQDGTPEHKDHEIYSRCTLNDDLHTFTCTEDCVDDNGEPLCFEVQQDWPK